MGPYGRKTSNDIVSKTAQIQLCNPGIITFLAHTQSQFWHNFGLGNLDQSAVSTRHNLHYMKTKNVKEKQQQP